MPILREQDKSPSDIILRTKTPHREKKPIMK
jgi:hypothetical protein